MPGGPADKPETANLPTGWERPTPRSPARPIPGIPREVTHPTSEGDATLQEGERRAAFLATRVRGGIQDIAAALSENPGATTPEILPTALSIFGATPQNIANSPARRRIEAAQLDVLDAALTLGTGAAYTKEQLEGYRQAYFPQIGDDPATVADKKQRLERLLSAARVNAGRAAPMIDQALALVNPSDDTDVRSEIERRIGSGESPDEVLAWLYSLGRAPTEEQIKAIYANAGNPRPDVRLPDGSSDIDVHLRSLGVGARGVVQGAGDIANLVSSPFIHGYNAITGSNVNPDMGDAAADMLGLPEAQSNAERLAFETNRFGTGAMTAAGLARQAARYVRPVAETLGGALQRFGNAPLTDAAAGATGGLSGEAARQQGAGPGGQMAATVIGGGLSLAPSALANRIANRPPAGYTTDLMRAGQQEGVTVNRAMQDPNLQPKVTAQGKTMVGARVMGREMAEVGDQIHGRVQALGRGGDVLDPAVAGQTVEGAAERYIKGSGKRLGRIYDNLEKQVGDIKVQPSESLARVDDAIARLSELGNTNSAELNYLAGLKNDLSKDLSVASLRRLRTTLRQKISKGDLTFGEDEARVLSIMDAASNDIARGLARQGKAGAAAAFKRVDTEYRDRMEFIHNTVQKIIGRRGQNVPAGKIIENLKAMALPKGDNAGFARMLREMTPEEQNDIAATFADALGRNADGDFSTAFLVKHLNRIPKGVRHSLFGSDGAKSIENIELLAKEHKRVQKALGGSPTALATDARSWMLNLIFGGGTFAAGGADLGSAATGAAVALGGAGIKAGKDAISAKALMSPKITGWLRSIPRTQDPKAINSAWDRLSAIAVREPALAPEVKGLQEMILRAVNDNVTPGVAASESDQPN